MSESISQFHEQIFQGLLKRRETDPSFTFSIRSKNDKNGRFRSGYWFQGDERYIFVAPFKIGDAHNKTKTIGLVLWFESGELVKSYLEVVFGDSINKAMSGFYKEVLNILGIPYEENKFKYQKDYIVGSKSAVDDVQKFFDQYHNELVKLIEAKNLQNQFLISENDFQKSLVKKAQMQALGPPSSGVNSLNEDEPDDEDFDSDLVDYQAPLNTILYGPPGTGKTYHTINYALSIIEGVSPANLELEDRSELKRRYDEYVESKKIVFTTFHQSMSYEDFIEGIKPKTEDSNLVYETREGVFQELSNRALDNWIEAQNPRGGVAFADLWAELIKPLDDDGEIVIKTLRGEFKIYEITDKTIRFEKQNKSRAHSLSLKTLKEMYSNPALLEKFGGLKTYYQGMLAQLNELKSKVMPKANVDLQNFVLIIDEINRGNISKIFGELITLIEPSKRIGADDEIKLTLPYSGDTFGVPQNLYILGTMNTADRSIALMDTALRRRFEFVEMMPKADLLHPLKNFLRFQKEYFGIDWNDPLYEVAEDSYNQIFEFIIDGQKGQAEYSCLYEETVGEDLRFKDFEILLSNDKVVTAVNNSKIRLDYLLNVINARIEYLYDRDHTIGHAYFIGIQNKAELDAVMRNKVIPLLQEYFYGDWEKIQIVLGDHYKQMKENSDATAFDQGINQLRFIQSRVIKEIDVLGFNHEDIQDESYDYKVSSEFPLEAYLRLCGMGRVTPESVKSERVENSDE